MSSHIAQDLRHAASVLYTALQPLEAMSKLTLGIIIVIATGIVAYLLGGAPRKPIWDLAMPPIVPQDAAALELHILQKEQRHRVKPGNEAHIVWADTSKQKTPYSVVYLHGFSGSQQEGYPVHVDFARRYRCNLYLSRLADHGVDTVDQMVQLTPDRLWNDAKEALVIGQSIGEKVILMGTSTGGSLALALAANYPNRVYALINMSPNIRINDKFAFLLNNHWGLQLARLVKGSHYIEKEQTHEEDKYWYSRYRIEAAVALEELLETQMVKRTFNKVKQPTLTLYYYKSEAEQDPVVRVDAMLRMHQQLATPDALKVEKAIPTAGTHVIGSSIASKGVAEVEQAVFAFAERQLKMKPVPR